MPLQECGTCDGCKMNERGGHSVYPCSKVTRVYPRTYTDLAPCSDGSCILRKPTGMHTNGGCRCLREWRGAPDWPEGLLREQRAVIACMRDEIARLKGERDAIPPKS